MGWLLGCFKCRKRYHGGSSLNPTATCKNQNKISVNAVHLSANSDQTQATSQGELVDFNIHPEKCEVERNVPTQGNSLDKSISASIKTEKNCLLARKRSSDQLLQVEKLKEELDNLNSKLVEEANEAKNLTNEVRYLRNCSELLDSPDAFKKAFDDLQRASEKGQVEESRHLLLLQSLLTKIESEGGALVEPCLGHKEKNRPLLSGSKSRAHVEIIEALMDLPKSMDSPFLVTQTESESSLESSTGKKVAIGPDKSQLTKASNALKVHRTSQEKKEEAEQKLFNTRKDNPSGYVNLDANQPQLIPVVRRRSCTALSFSGFFLVEDGAGNRFTSEQFESEDPSCTESSGSRPSTKNIEETDLSSENIDEASKSLFAFATDASLSQSFSAEQAVSLNVSQDDIFSNTGSEVDSQSVKQYSIESCCTSCYRPSRWLQSGNNAHEVQVLGTNSTMNQSQVCISDNGYDRFSDVLSRISLECSNERNAIDEDSEKLDSGQVSHGSDASSSKTSPQLHIPSVEDKSSAKKSANPHVPVRDSTMSQEENAVIWKKMSTECSSSTEIQAEKVLRNEDYPVLSPQHQSVALTETADKWKVIESESKDSNGNLKSEVLITFQETNSKEASLSGGLNQSSSNRAAVLGQKKLLVSESSDEGTFKQELTPSITVTAISPEILALPSLVHGQGISKKELSSSGANSALTPNPETSPHTIHTQSPLPYVVTTKQELTLHRLSLNSPPEMLSPPNSIHSQLPVPLLSSKGASKTQLTPSRTPSASSSQVETPSSVQSQVSPAKLAEDRPILGTVAAHWSHSSATQKWWDGKGIPNSTNKYKEDQKVSWHATPFEVRLERALAKQGRVLQKKLFSGSIATEMEVSTGPITSPS